MSTAMAKRRDGAAGGELDVAMTEERWQSRWNVPIIIAAVLPLFMTSPDSKGVEVVVGVGSWLVFVVDLVVQWRIVPGYLRQRRGMLDLAIVIFTFPIYLI